MPTLDTTRLFCTRAGIFSIIAACFSIPLSTSLTGLFTSLVLLFWIVSGTFLTVPKIVTSQPVALVATALFLLFVIGLFYSPVGLGEAGQTLKKYRELLFYPIIISFLAGNKTAGKRAEIAFVAGCIVLLLISCAISLSLIPPQKYGNSIIYHITHSYFMAILAFWAVHRAVDSHRYRIFWLLLLILTLTNLVFIAPGRTGMLVFLFLTSLFFMQRLPLKKQVAAFLVLITLAALSYHFTKNVSTRVDKAFTEIQNFEQGKSRTSLGNRFNWYYNSVTLMQEKPITGHGTGSFEHAQKKIIKGTKILRTINPHNEYLFIGVQLGWIGLLLFLILFVLQWACSLKLAPPQRWMLQGVTVSMATGCLMNSLLFDSAEGHYFVFLSSVFLAQYHGGSFPFLGSRQRIAKTTGG